MGDEKEGDMAEENFPKDFCCPHCKSTETVAGVVTKPDRDAGRISPEETASLEQTLVPIVLPNTILGLTIPALKIHYDICWDCGTRYVTRIENTRIKQPNTN